MTAVSPRRGPTKAGIAAIVAAGLTAALVSTPTLGSAPASPEAAFMAENAVAMDRMMAGMAVRPTGDIEQDFVAMMEPHHRGAIEMAQAELRHGHNEQLRRIAQEIIVEQQQEIAAMRLAIGRPLPPAAPADDQTKSEPRPAPSPHAAH